MRKSYLILAAVATILASCAENSKINNDLRSDETKTVIGFSSYSEKATRSVDSPTDLEYYHNTFAVFATKAVTIDSQTEIQNVFGEEADATAPVDGTTCTYVDGSATNPLFYDSNWKYTNERFWDTRAIYDFIAYAPAAAPIKFQYSAADARVKADGNKFVSDGAVTLYGQNLQDGSKGTDAEIVKGFTSSDATNKKDIDIMVSALVADQDGRDYVRTQPRQDINLVFHHILSKLNIRIAKDKFLDNVKINIKSIELGGLKHVGTFGDENKVNKWNAADRETNSEYALTFNKDNTESNWTELPKYDYSNDVLKYKYFVESIVMPQVLPETCNLTVKYEIISGSDTNNPHTERYTSTTNISDSNIFTDFVEGYNYTLSVVIRPNVITFDASAAAWDTEGATIDINR